MTRDTELEYEQLLERCRSLARCHGRRASVRTSALAGAIEAGAKGLITPILVGPAAKIDAIAKRSGIDLGHAGSSMRRTAMLRPRRPWNWCGRARPSC